MCEVCLSKFTAKTQSKKELRRAMPLKSMHFQKAFSPSQNFCISGLLGRILPNFKLNVEALNCWQTFVDQILHFYSI